MRNIIYSLQVYITYTIYSTIFCFIVSYCLYLGDGTHGDSESPKGNPLQNENKKKTRGRAAFHHSLLFFLFLLLPLSFALAFFAASRVAGTARSLSCCICVCIAKAKLPLDDASFPAEFLRFI